LSIPGNVKKSTILIVLFAINEFWDFEISIQSCEGYEFSGLLLISDKRVFPTNDRLSQYSTPTVKTKSEANSAPFAPNMISFKGNAALIVLLVIIAFVQYDNFSAQLYTSISLLWPSKFILQLQILRFLTGLYSFPSANIPYAWTLRGTI